MVRVCQIAKQIVARQKGVYGLTGDDLFANLAKVRQDFQRMARVCQIGKQIASSQPPSILTPVKHTSFGFHSTTDVW